MEQAQKLTETLTVVQKLSLQLELERVAKLQAHQDLLKYESSVEKRLCKSFALAANLAVGTRF